MEVTEGWNAIKISIKRLITPVMKSYFLTTERLGFSIWHEDDIRDAARLWGDPAVTRYLVTEGRMTPDQVQERLLKEIECFRVNGIQYWPVFLRDGDEFVGCCGLRPVDGNLKHMEMGVHLVKEQWRTGIATEACRAVIQYAFEHLQAECIFAGHHPENRVTPRLLERLGFRFLKEKHYPPTGLMHPSYILQTSIDQP
jgi:RimJ/RimL family protein N-acetyltransferase